MQAQLEANLMQMQWNNKGPNLWTQDMLPIMTEPGIATYPIPGITVMVTNVTIGLSDPPTMQDLTISPVSRQMYSMYPNKNQPGRPTVYWFDRQLSPTITLWPVPDTVYTMKVWRFRVMQDAVLANARAFEVPVLWLDAACAGMAYRLSMHYAQEPRGKAQGAGRQGVHHCCDAERRGRPALHPAADRGLFQVSHGLRVQKRPSDHQPGEPARLRRL